MPLSTRFVRFAPRTARFLLLTASDTLSKAWTLLLDAPLKYTEGENRTYRMGVDGATNVAPGIVQLTGQLGGTSTSPDVRGLRVTGGAVGEGAQLLSIGAVKSGEALARNGSSVVGMSRGLNWQAPVKRKDLATPPAEPALGDRYLVPSGAQSPWNDKANHLAEWGGESVGWTYNSPETGAAVFVEDLGAVFAFQGSSWGNPHEFSSKKDQNNGYAGLDGAGVVNRPVRLVRGGDDPVSGTAGEIWLNQSALRYRDGSANHTVVTEGRQVQTGPGLTGGGALSQNLTLKIASFTGIVSKDVDPASSSWNGNEVKNHTTLDVGAEGMLLPVGVRLPPTVSGSLRTEAVFELDDQSQVILENSSTTNALEESLQGLAYLLAGGLSNSAQKNGRRVKKITLRTRNTTGDAVNDVDLDAFRLRAFAFPRGDGNAL